MKQVVALVQDLSLTTFTVLINVCVYVLLGTVSDPCGPNHWGIINSQCSSSTALQSPINLGTYCWKTINK